MPHVFKRCFDTSIFIASFIIGINITYRECYDQLLATVFRNKQAPRVSSHKQNTGK